VPSNDPVQRFSDIIENIERIVRFTAGMDPDAFASNEQTVLAVKYSLLVISEAAVKLGDTAGKLCPEIPWREIRGLGNRLRHDYDNIETIRIWRLVDRDLPPLRSACQRALIALEDDEKSGPS
jgi:uncharacterized protein with HEPN domain